MKEINVAVTGGAGQIAYSLLPRLVSGETFGPDTKVNLRLIEIPQVVDKLQGTIMELIDCGFDDILFLVNHLTGSAIRYIFHARLKQHVENPLVSFLIIKSHNPRLYCRSLFLDTLPADVVR